MNDQNSHITVISSRNRGPAKYEDIPENPNPIDTAPLAPANEPEKVGGISIE